MKTLLSIITLLTLNLSYGINIDFISGGTIESSITLNVLEDYSSIQEALDAIDGRNITDQATVDISVSDGTYSLSDPIYISPNISKNVRIIGNTSDPSAVVLNFPNNTSGFVLQTQNLSKIDGFTLNGTKTQQTFGIICNTNCSLNIGANTVIKNFSFGIITQGNSLIHATGSQIESCQIGVAANSLS